jgi:hypothetical protein
MAHLKAGRFWRRSVRVGGEPRHQYFGSGPAGLAVALMDAEEIGERERQRQARHEADAEQLARQRMEAARGKAVRRLLSIVLEANGLIRYRRNPWRKCMKRRIELARRTDPGPPPTESQIRNLASKVRENSPDALHQFAELAEQWPEQVAASTAADLCWVAKITLANQGGAGKHADIAIGIETQMALVERELIGDSGSPSLRMAAAVATFSWCELWTLNAIAAHNGIEKATPASSARRSAAQRRLLTALRTLEQIRRIEEM